MASGRDAGPFGILEDSGDVRCGAVVLLVEVAEGVDDGVEVDGFGGEDRGEAFAAVEEGGFETVPVDFVEELDGQLHQKAS